MNSRTPLIALTLLFIALTPLAAGHEIYVLPHDTAAANMSQPSPDPFSAVTGKEPEFVLIGVLGALVVAFVFFISVSRRLEDRFEEYIMAMKPYAGLIARWTLGASLIAGAYYGGVFGPEITFEMLSGPVPELASMLRLAVLFVGLALLFGLGVRVASLLSIVLFLGVAYTQGVYALNYLGYLGISLFLFAEGSESFSMEIHFLEKLPVVGRLVTGLERYRYPLFRALFGASLIFASFYAKYWHSNLALQTVTMYNLTQFIPFDPLFIVLGAFLTEVVIGLFFIVGFEMRFATAFIAGMLTISALYFTEPLWPHILLYGSAITMFFHGYDSYTLQSFLADEESGEPVL